MLDFTRLCKELNIPFLESGHHHCHEGWIQVHCPFCTDGTHGWHLGYNTEKGNMNCWRGGSHNLWEWLSFILKNRGTSVKQVLNQYSQTDFLPVKKKQIIRKRIAKKPLNMTSLYPVHEKYLKQKGFNPKKIIKEWELKATSGVSEEWSWRIIAPIKDISGTITGYAGRALNEETRPKWKFSRNEEMSDDPKKMIYGIDKAQNRVLVVEGVGDVWRMGPGAAGILGIDWKEEQASILKNFSHRYIMFDPEAQAQKKAKELANWLAPFRGDTEIIDQMNCDPGDLLQKDADNVMKELGF